MTPTELKRGELLLKRQQLNSQAVIASMPDFEAFRESLRARQEHIAQRLQTQELSSYMLGKLQGQISELSFLMLDSAELAERQSKIDRELEGLDQRQSNPIQQALVKMRPEKPGRSR